MVEVSTDDSGSVSEPVIGSDVEKEPNSDFELEGANLFLILILELILDFESRIIRVSFCILLFWRGNNIQQIELEYSICSILLF